MCAVSLQAWQRRARRTAAVPCRLRTRWSRLSPGPCQRWLRPTRGACPSPSPPLLQPAQRRHGRRLVNPVVQSRNGCRAGARTLTAGTARWKRIQGQTPLGVRGIDARPDLSCGCCTIYDADSLWAFGCCEILDMRLDVAQSSTHRAVASCLCFPMLDSLKVCRQHTE